MRNVNLEIVGLLYVMLLLSYRRVLFVCMFLGRLLLG
jgi:hypothetical protein